MKSFKSLFAMVVMLALLGSTAMAAPKTIIVNKSGDAGTTTSVAGAAAIAAAGDTIEITDSAVYDETASIVLRGVTLKGTAMARPTIKSSAAAGAAGWVAVLVDSHDSTIENIQFAGQDLPGDGVGQHCIWAAGSIAIHNCFIRDFNGGYALLGLVRNDKVLAGEMTGTYVINTGVVSGPTIQFQITDAALHPALEVPEADRPTAAAVGPFMIDHCTILGFANHQIGFGVYYPTWGENMTLKNSIIGPFKKTETTINNALTQWGGVIVVDPLLDAKNSPTIAGGHPGTYPADRATNSIKVIRNNNCYLYVAGDMLCWEWGNMDMKNSTVAGPGDLVGKDKAIDPGFVDLFGYNLELKPESKLIGRGEGGSTVGAFQAPGPPQPQIIVRKDGLNGAKTKISAALAASTPGDLIEIQDSEVYTETVNLQLTGVTLRGAVGQRPTIKCTYKSGGSYTWVLNCNGFNLENLNIESQGANLQQGIVGGGIFSIKNCTFKNCNLNLGMSGQGDFGGTISDCYILESGGVISLTTWAGVLADCKPITVDHCTIVGKIWPLAAGQTGTPAASPYLLLDSSYLIKNGSNVTIKNTIMATHDDAGAWIKPPHVFFRDAVTMAVNHSYNLYANPSTDFVLDSTEVKGDPLFTDVTKFDETGYSVKTSPRSPAIKKAEEGKTIGVYQAPVPNASKSWTVFE